MFPSVKTLTDRLNLTKEAAEELREAMSRHQGLACCNRLMGAHGVEAIEVREVGTVEYVNQGDTYDVTLLHYGGRYHVGSWGDLVERYDY